jgi:DNA-binding response OmpR family regulator
MPRPAIYHNWLLGIKGDGLAVSRSKEWLLMTGDRKPVRILCVDDEPAPLGAYKCILEPHGYEVVTTLDSIEALRIMLREPVDLLIQDLARPAVNGFELYAMLRANERLKNVPVVICSGGDESRRTFLERYPEVACVLAKPFDVEVLLDAVRKALPSVAGECGEEPKLQFNRRQMAEGHEWRARWKAGEKVLQTTDWQPARAEAQAKAQDWKAGAGKPPEPPEAPPVATPTREPEKPQKPRQMLTGSMKRLRGWALVAVVLAAAGGYYALTHRKVCGYVANIHFSASTRGQPTFLDLGQPYPNQDFTVVIWASDLSRFTGSPNDLYLGKNICVAGPIVKYRGRPEIVVHDPWQISVTE